MTPLGVTPATDLAAGAETSANGDTPLLSVLIPTMPHRAEKFAGLLGSLLPQAGDAGQVEVIALFNNGERPLGEYRQRLLEEARGAYVCFADDDDEVSGDYVAWILQALETRPDVVGFDVENWADGQRSQWTRCSLTHRPEGSSWTFREMTHIQPVRRDLALRGDFRRAWPEDRDWVSQVAPLVSREVFIPRVLYSYRYSSQDTVQGTLRRVPDPPPRPVVTSPVFRWAEV